VETIMVKPGAVYQPELIKVMKTALDEAASILPAAEQTCTVKVALASRILTAAARGVRDPMQLKMVALMAVDEAKDGNDIYRDYAQLQRLRQQVEEAEAGMQAESDDARRAQPRTGSSSGTGRGPAGLSRVR
jgi:hypothetical protein